MNIDTFEEYIEENFFLHDFQPNAYFKSVSPLFQLLFVCLFGSKNIFEFLLKVGMKNLNSPPHAFKTDPL